MPTPRWEPTRPDLVPDTPPPTVAASSESTRLLAATRLPSGRDSPRRVTELLPATGLTAEEHTATLHMERSMDLPCPRSPSPLDPRRSDSSKGSANASQKTSHRNPRCDQSGRRRHLVRHRRQLRPGCITAPHQCPVGTLPRCRRQQVHRRYGGPYLGLQQPGQPAVGAHLRRRTAHLQRQRAWTPSTTDGARHRGGHLVVQRSAQPEWSERERFRSPACSPGSAWTSPERDSQRHRGEAVDLQRADQPAMEHAPATAAALCGRRLGWCGRSPTWATDSSTVSATPAPRRRPSWQPLHLNQLRQPPPGTQHRPNGSPAPVGDALVVAPHRKAVGSEHHRRHGRLLRRVPLQLARLDRLDAPRGQDDRGRQGPARRDNINAWEPWNEPDWTWPSSAGQLHRRLDPYRPADPAGRQHRAGPRAQHLVLERAWMRNFLTAAKAPAPCRTSSAGTSCPAGSTSTADVAAYRALEASLGISPRPISIDEYATTGEIDVPSSVNHYIAQFERDGVRDAERAFWYEAGTLNGLLYNGQPTASYWMYRWYARPDRQHRQGDPGGSTTASPPTTPARRRSAS